MTEIKKTFTAGSSVVNTTVVDTVLKEFSVSTPSEGVSFNTDDISLLDQIAKAISEIQKDSKITLSEKEEDILIDMFKEVLQRLSSGGYYQNSDTIKKNFKNFYRKLDWHDDAEVFIVSSPQAAQELAKKELEQESDDIVPYSPDISFRSKGWITKFNFLKKYCPGSVTEEEINNVQMLEDLTDGCFGCILFEDAVIVIRYPLFVCFDDDNKLHCETGPAIKFADGYEMYFLKERQYSKEEFNKKFSK